MKQRDAPARIAHGARRLDIILDLDAHHLAAGQASEDWRRRDADRDHGVAEAQAQECGEHNRHDHKWADQLVAMGSKGTASGANSASNTTAAITTSPATAPLRFNSRRKARRAGLSISSVTAAGMVPRTASVMRYVLSRGLTRT